MLGRPGLAAGWVVAVGLAVGVRVWNALTGSLMWGYDAWGHMAYVFFLDAYRAVPWADQGWSYFHPPLHYAFGWALAQLGSGELLVRGLSGVGAAASLGTAVLAAWVVRMASPGQPALSLLGFCAVAFLPAHVFVGGMPGNEMTSCLFSAAALATFVANECRARPTLRGDAFTGLWIGLGLLTKFTGLVALGAVGASLAVAWLLSRDRRGDLQRVIVRGLVVLGVTVLIAWPYYARNFATYGGPFQKSSDFALVGEVERDQPPGARTWRDYVYVSPRLFTDPNPLAPHLVRSVWGTLYLSAWAEIFRESDSERALEAERQTNSSHVWMAILGLLPTGLAFFGVALAARDTARGRRRAVYVPMLVTWVLGFVAMALYAWVVPRWPAVKAAYVFVLSVPYAVFVSRGVEALAGQGAALRLAARGQGAAWRLAVPAGLAVVALSSGAVNTSGLVVRQRADSPGMGPVHYYFGEYDDARRIYARLIAGSRYPVAWLDNLAAAELASGERDRARRYYARAVSLERSAGRSNPARRGQLAASLALAGDLDGARRELDEALAEAWLPELLANRGAIRALGGDRVGAETDLRAALTLAPGQVPAWENLAWVLDRDGRPGSASGARARAAARACRAPREYPYGVGTGEVLEWGIGRRLLLRIEADDLAPALPSYYRQACARLANGAG